MGMHAEKKHSCILTKEAVLSSHFYSLVACNSHAVSSLFSASMCLQAGICSNEHIGGKEVNENYILSFY